MAEYLGKTMYKSNGHEKNKEGDWNYDTHFHSRKYKEGTRLAYYIKIKENVQEQGKIIS